MTHRLNHEKDAKYQPLPAISPYTNPERYSRVKETHKYYIKQFYQHLHVKASLRVLDVGCGNGELLHIIHNEFPNWELKGVDPTPEFIQCAKNFDGLKAVDFSVGDIESIDGHYDLVLCTGVLQIFSDFEKPLSKLLGVTKVGGHVIVDGLFNKYNVETRLQYCDNSNTHAQGVWRTDWNQHSQQKISNYLSQPDVNGKKIKSFTFNEIEMEADLEKNKDLHIQQFTFRDQDGKNIITNGTNMILNKTMLIIQK